MAHLLERLWPWKREVKKSLPLTEAQLHDTLQFTNGYLLAMSHGVSGLEDRVVNQAAERMLAQLEGTIIARAEAVGHHQARSVLDLQKKQAEFEAKQAGAKSEEERMKYLHYLEALKWMLPTNGSVE